MTTIDVCTEGGNWADGSELEQLAGNAIARTSEVVGLNLPDDSEVSIVFTNDAHVQELNRNWRQQDKPTNVLSFATNDGIAIEKWSPLLGDIILAYETINREAKTSNIRFNDHLSHLIVHGYLHLLGYDHIDDEDAVVMENLETQALKQMGIADPYSRA